MTDLMIDIETLSTQPNAQIASVGACTFDMVGVHGAFGWVVDRGIDPRFHQEIETLYWWIQQDQEAIFNSFMAPRDSLEDVLAGLNYKIEAIQPKRIWANDPQFDLSILRNAYRVCGVTPAWTYKQERSYRTIVEAAGVKKSPPTHSAINDAKVQAEDVISAYTTLGIQLC